MAPDRRLSGTGVTACAAALLLLGVGFEMRRRDVDVDVASEGHHQRVRLAAESAIPYSFGPWIGKNVETVEGTEEILRPNVLVQRDYENLRTGERVSVLFVQSLDARALVGHFPPVCYPAHGLVPGPAVARGIDVGGSKVDFMRYSFSRTDIEAASTIVVDNFMVLPDGGIVLDMKAVDRAAADSRTRHLGAAQFQIVTDSSMPEERRDEVFREIVERNLPLLASLISSPEAPSPQASSTDVHE